MKYLGLSIGTVLPAIAVLFAAGAAVAEPGSQVEARPKPAGGEAQLVFPAEARPADRPALRQGAWLGLQLAPVPAALASHLKLSEDAGVMVRNVFKGSPADEAGLQRYDVVTAVDGRPVEGGIEKFADYLHRKKPGDEVTLALYRGGEELEQTVPLVEPPRRVDESALKYEDDPDVAQRQLFGLRGKILRPGPNGWILDDLDELPQLPDLDRWFRQSPRPDDRQPPTGDTLQEARRVDDQGQVLHVRRNENGSIEVRRYPSDTPAEKAEPKTYKNLRELREADPEAAELLSSIADEPRPPREQEGRRRGAWPREDDVRRHQDSMRQYQDALREYLKRYRDRFQPNMPQSPGAPGGPQWKDRMAPGGPQPPFGQPAPGERRELQGPQPPQAHFEVHPDGSITVHVEDGPTRLDMTFPDERAFEQHVPKLYERYRDSIDRVR